MHENLIDLIDRSRQRAFTREESTFVARHARRMEQGCDVADALAAHEAMIVDAVLTKVVREFPDVATRNAASLDALRQLLPMILRQGALAAALDDSTRLCVFLCDAQKAWWGLSPSARFSEFALEGLREECLAKLPAHGAPHLDHWLRISSLFLTATAAFAEQRERVLNEPVMDLMARHPEAEAKLPGIRRKVAADLQKVLLHCLRALLPDGAERLMQCLRVVHEQNAQDRTVATLLAEGTRLLLQGARQAISSRHLAFAEEELERSVTFLTLSVTLYEKKDELLQRSIEELFRRHPAAASRTPDTTEKARRDEWLILEASALATLPGGAKHLRAAMTELEQTMNRTELGARVMADAYQILLDSARAALPASALAQMEPVLHRAAHFTSIQADLASQRESLFPTIADQLEREFPSYYQQHRTAKAYTVRDQEQILNYIAMGLLPEGRDLSAERFALFGEVLMHSDFPQPLMEKSYALLEQAILSQMTGQSVCFLLPRFRRLRSFMLASQAIGPVATKIARDAAEPVRAKYAADLARLDGGADRLAEDLRLLLHLALGTLVPDYENALVRGLSSLFDALADAKLPVAAADLAVKGLLKAAAAQIPAPHAERVMPALQACASFYRLAADVAQHREAIVAGTLETVYAKHTDVAARHGSARRHGASDVAKLLKFTSIATVPAGTGAMAANLALYGRVLEAYRFGEEFIGDFFAAARKMAAKHLDRESMAALAPSLDAAVQTCSIHGELAEKHRRIGGEVLKELNAKHGAALDEPATRRDMLVNQVYRVLWGSALTTFAGGQRAFANQAKAVGLEYLHGHWSPALVQDTHEALLRVAKAELSKNALRTVAPALEASRDYFVVCGGLGQSEADILKESVDRLFNGRSTQMASYSLAREHSMHDERLVLRSSALALLPGGEEEHLETAQLLAAVCEKHHFARDLMQEAYAHLRESCTNRLKQGPIKQLAGNIERSVRIFAP